MWIIVMISILVVWISLVLLAWLYASSQYKTKKNFHMILVILVAVFGIVGLIVSPTFIPIKTDYKQININRCEITRAHSKIILDISNINDYKDLANKLPNLNEFNSYDMVTSYDSTKTRFFFKEDKSYYNVVLLRKIVWSNNDPHENVFKTN